MTPDFIRRRPWLATAGIALAATAAAACIAAFRSTEARADASPAGTAPVAVSVAAVSESEFTAWEEFSGRIEAVERVEIRSRVAGAIQAVHFREGALVRRGDLLITIDPAPYAADEERAQAQVAAAQARRAQAQSELSRAQRLAQEQAIAQRELDERSHAARESDANLRAAEAQLQAARLALDYTRIRAPLSGRIGKLEITPGNLVAAGPGAPLLTTIVSVSPVYASFEANEQAVHRLLQGTPGGANGAIERIPVQMGTASGSDTPYRGRLQLIDNQVDAASGTIRLRAAFVNGDGSLIPGQFARVRLGQPHATRAVLVAERAIGTDQDKKFVYVVDASNTARYREVTLGGPVAGMRVVLEGLHPGERIVVNGLQRVHAGVPVQPLPATPEPRA